MDKSLLPLRKDEYASGKTDRRIGVFEMVKIVIDAGHGFDTPGKRSPANEREWLFNDKVVRATIAKLQTYEGVEILRVDDPTGKTDVPLKIRTNKANEWKADVYVSIHHNALTEEWGEHSGIETYTMNQSKANPKSKEIAAAVHPRIVKAMGIRDRGIKQANFHVLRETAMPAILTEGGFMDSIVDIIKLRDEQYLKAEGEAIAEGLAAYINLKPKSTKENTLYKPTSKELIDATTIVLQHLESSRKGVIPKKWLKAIDEGTLTDSNAIGLLYVVIHHWLTE